MRWAQICSVAQLASRICCVRRGVGCSCRGGLLVPGWAARAGVAARRSPGGRPTSRRRRSPSIDAGTRVRAGCSRVPLSTVHCPLSTGGPAVPPPARAVPSPRRPRRSAARTAAHVSGREGTSSRRAWKMGGFATQRLCAVVAVPRVQSWASINPHNQSLNHGPARC